MPRHLIANTRERIDEIPLSPSTIQRNHSQGNGPGMIIGKILMGLALLGLPCIVPFFPAGRVRIFSAMENNASASGIGLACADITSRQDIVADLDACHVLG